MYWLSFRQFCKLTPCAEFMWQSFGSQKLPRCPLWTEPSTASCQISIMDWLQPLFPIPLCHSGEKEGEGWGKGIWSLLLVLTALALSVVNKLHWSPVFESVLSRMVIGEWSPSSYLNPQVLSWSTFSPSSFEEREREKLSRLNQRQLTITTLSQTWCSDTW